MLTDLAMSSKKEQTEIYSTVELFRKFSGLFLRWIKH